MQKTEFDLLADIESRHWWFTGRRQIIQVLLNYFVPPAKQNLVLDFGCGTGANIASLADDYRVVGLDSSEFAIEHARRSFPNVEFLLTSGDEQHFDQVEQASAVTIMDVLEHLPDDYETLSRLLDAASPGAHFLITVPANIALWSKHDEIFGHYRRYSLEGLRRVWEGLDVECRMISYFNARLYPIVRSIRERKRKQGDADSYESDLKIPAPPLNALLHAIFAGESRRLLRAVQEPGVIAYPQGVSLVAVLRRGDGPIGVRRRPVDAEPDYYDPVRREFLCPTPVE